MKCVLLTFLLKVSPGERLSLESWRSCSKNLCQIRDASSTNRWMLWSAAQIPYLPRTEVLGLPADGDCWQGHPFCGQYAPKESRLVQDLQLLPVTSWWRLPVLAPWPNLVQSGRALLISTALCKAGSDPLHNCCSASLCP